MVASKKVFQFCRVFGLVLANCSFGLEQKEHYEQNCKINDLRKFLDWNILELSDLSTNSVKSLIYK